MTDEMNAPNVILLISEKGNEREMKNRLNAPNVGKNNVSRKETCKESQ